MENKKLFWVAVAIETLLIFCVTFLIIYFMEYEGIKVDIKLKISLSIFEFILIVWFNAKKLLN